MFPVIFLVALLLTQAGLRKARKPTHTQHTFKPYTIHINYPHNTCICGAGARATTTAKPTQANTNTNPSGV